MSGGGGGGHIMFENITIPIVKFIIPPPPPPPPPPIPLRIQPLSGRISAVTQLPTPSTQSTSTNTTSEERPQDTSTAEGGEGSKREDSGQTEGGENVASTAGQTVVPGGMFAGVGEFSSTLNPQVGSAGAQMKDLKMKYAKDAMLR